MLGGGGIGEHEASAVTGGGGIEEQVTAVSGGGGTDEQDARAVAGGGGIGEHEASAVSGGGGIGEHEASAVTGGGTEEQPCAVLGGGGISDPERAGRRALADAAFHIPIVHLTARPVTARRPKPPSWHTGPFPPRAPLRPYPRAASDRQPGPVDSGAFPGRAGIRLRLRSRCGTGSPTRRTERRGDPFSRGGCPGTR